jgi:acyl-CoA thioester hydrolase
MNCLGEARRTNLRIAPAPRGRFGVGAAGIDSWVAIADDDSMLYRFVVDVPLRWVDFDSAGVVNNAVYLSLMEQARFAYFQQLDLLAKNRVEFVLAEAKVCFLRPGRFGMQTQVAVRTSHLGTTSFRMHYEVRAGEKVLATGEVALVFVDDAMKPRPIPDAVRRAIRDFEGLPEAVGE